MKYLSVSAPVLEINVSSIANLRRLKSKIIYRSTHLFIFMALSMIDVSPSTRGWANLSLCPSGKRTPHGLMEYLVSHSGACFLAQAIHTIGTPLNMEHTGIIRMTSQELWMVCTARYIFGRFDSF